MDGFGSHKNFGVAPPMDEGWVINEKIARQFSGTV